MIYAGQATGWNTANILTVVGIVATFLTSLAALIVSGLTLAHTKVLDRARLASDLWGRQATFASEFWPAIERIAEAVTVHGYRAHETTISALKSARLVLLKHAAFLPDEIHEALDLFLNKTNKMMTKAEMNLPVGEGRNRVVGEAFEILEKLFVDAGFKAEEMRLRGLLHTNELSKARGRALGI